MDINYLKDLDNIEFELVPYNNLQSEYNLDKIIFDLDTKLIYYQVEQIVLIILSLLPVGLFVVCLTFLGRDFDLNQGREIASDKIDDFVKKIAEKKSKKFNDLRSAVEYLEEAYKIPSDGNTPDLEEDCNTI